MLCRNCAELKRAFGGWTSIEECMQLDKSKHIDRFGEDEQTVSVTAEGEDGRQHSTERAEARTKQMVFWWRKHVYA
jgi:hypothetical protein